MVNELERPGGHHWTDSDTGVELLSAASQTTRPGGEPVFDWTAGCTVILAFSATITHSWRL